MFFSLMIYDEMNKRILPVSVWPRNKDEEDERSCNSLVLLLSFHFTGGEEEEKKSFVLTNAIISKTLFSFLAPFLSPS